MGPKKGKGKDKKEEAPQEESEYAIMDLEMLKELVPMLRQQVEKNVMDRNYVQLERVISILITLLILILLIYINTNANINTTTTRMLYNNTMI